MTGWGQQYDSAACSLLQISDEEEEEEGGGRITRSGRSICVTGTRWKHNHPERKTDFLNQHRTFIQDGIPFTS
ncbi:Hypothetical predicted protein [Scomber scombrus]|uniref:Uncharacterized protein n=1 Tax=Scomber scombrus TaxID=13677 RepID=A0AAV1PI18_SCOSC